MLALLLVAPFQTTWIVDVAGAGPGQGTAADPYTSVTYALQQPSTVAGDTVLVEPGTYTNESIDFLGKTLVIRSSGGPAVTRLESVPIQQPAATVVRAVSGEGPGTLLEGFTIEGVRGDFVINPFGGGMLTGGGAVVCIQSTIELRNVEITGGGQVSFGGGVYIDGGSVQLNGVTFLDGGDPNNTILGGGLYAGGGALVRMTSCRFERNSASANGCGAALEGCFALFSDTAFVDQFGFNAAGGGLYVDASDIRMEDCSLSGNAGGFNGGGIFARGGSLRLERTDFVNNQAGTFSDPYAGGAVNGSGVDLTVLDCEFSFNRGQFGGAISSSGTATIEDCVLRNNSVAGAGQFSSRGGAIEAFPSTTIRRSLFVNNSAGDTYSGGGGAVAGQVAIDACTFVGNTAIVGTAGTISSLQNGTVTGSIVVGGGPSPVAATAVTYSNVEGGAVGAGNIDADPGFWDAAADFRLLPGSSAIDTGDPAAPVDPDGTRRDMGAFPFDPSVGDDIGTSTCVANSNSTGVAAVLTARGSNDVSADRVTLHVEAAPSGSLGYFLTSRSGGSQTLGNGSQGLLCLGGSVLRFSATTLDDRGTGVVSFRPLVGNFPQGHVAMSGDTWFFQYWFRDANPQPTSNTSSAVQVVFQ